MRDMKIQHRDMRQKLLRCKMWDIIMRYKVARGGKYGTWKCEQHNIWKAVLYKLSDLCMWATTRTAEHISNCTTQGWQQTRLWKQVESCCVRWKAHRSQTATPTRDLCILALHAPTDSQEPVTSNHNRQPSHQMRTATTATYFSFDRWPAPGAGAVRTSNVLRFMRRPSTAPRKRLPTTVKYYHHDTTSLLTGHDALTFSPRQWCNFYLYKLFVH